MHLRQESQPGDAPQGIQKQPAVLEHAQRRQIEHNADDQDPAPGLLFRALALPDHPPAGVVHHDGADHHQHIDRFAVGVKEQVGQQQERIAHPERQHMAHQQDNRQEQKQKRQT